MASRREMEQRLLRLEHEVKGLRLIVGAARPGGLTHSEVLSCMDEMLGPFPQFGRAEKNVWKQLDWLRMKTVETERIAKGEVKLSDREISAFLDKRLHLPEFRAKVEELVLDEQARLDKAAAEEKAREA